MEGGWGKFYNVALLVHFMMQTRIITISLVLKLKCKKEFIINYSSS
jgi:hypothetical protein